MTSLLVAIALGSRCSQSEAAPPDWAIVDFRESKTPNSKFAVRATSAFVVEWGKQVPGRIADLAKVRAVWERFNVDRSPDSRIASDFAREELRARTLIEGDLVDYVVRPANGGWQAEVDLKIMAYDNGFRVPTNGAFSRGFSEVHYGQADESSLLDEAFTKAAALAIRAMRSRHIPSGRVFLMTVEATTIDRGTAEGFRVGRTVVISRGISDIGKGHIVAVDKTQSQIKLDIVLSISPGDKVRMAYYPEEGATQIIAGSPSEAPR